MKRRDFLITTTGAAGSFLSTLAFGQSRPCPPPAVGVADGQSASTSCDATSAEADWLYRTGQDAARPQPGVVWFHDFRSDAEVNNFRWTGGYGSGNDPNGTGSSLSANLRRITTDPQFPGGCLEILRPQGADDVSEWWRPFSPIAGGTTSGNGRGVGNNDPGANGSLPPQTFAPTNGGNQTVRWVDDKSRQGWYTHPSNYDATLCDGTEFYLQFRVKMDPRRTTSGNIQVGKLLYFCNTSESLPSQQIVTYSGAFAVGGVGQPNYHRIFVFGSPPLEDVDSLGRPGQQCGSDLANYGAGQYCSISNASLRGYCWAYSGGWDTFLYHIIPGRDGVEETRLVVYAAHPGETAYTKIWDVVYATGYSATDYKGSVTQPGWNAMKFGAYQNGQYNSEFFHRYAQAIFSRSYIPLPDDPVQRGVA